MIAHLRGRAEALGPFGWSGRRAEWIASANSCPSGSNRGAAGNLPRHFPLGLPVTLDDEHAVFVYADLRPPSIPPGRTELPTGSVTRPVGLADADAR